MEITPYIFYERLYLIGSILLTQTLYIYIADFPRLFDVISNFHLCKYISYIHLYNIYQWSMWKALPIDFPLQTSVFNHILSSYIFLAIFTNIIQEDLNAIDVIRMLNQNNPSLFGVKYSCYRWNFKKYLLITVDGCDYATPRIVDYF